MEDAATAEISRAQVWQWIHHRAKMNNGTSITPDLVRRTISEELDKSRNRLGSAQFDSGKFDLAGKLFDQMMTSSEFADFMPLAAYDFLS
jgi:malate synthase